MLVFQSNAKAPLKLLHFCTKWKENLERRFSKSHQKLISTKMEVFENALIFNNEFHKTEQCERAKKEIFGSVLLMMWINVTVQKWMFSLCFSTKTKQCEWVASMQKRRIITKTEQCEAA